MTGDENIWDLADEHVVFVFWGKGGVSSIGGCEVSFLQHQLHDLGRLVVVEALDVRGVIQEALPMVGEDLDPMEREIGGIADENEFFSAE